MIQIKRMVLILLLGTSGTLFAQRRLISHVTSASGGFTTQVIVANTSGEAQPFSLKPFGADGSDGRVYTGNVGAGETLWLEPSDIFVSNPGYFQVESEPGVQVSVSYQHLTTASPAHVTESTETANLWRLYPGDWDTVWDGLAVVNMGDEMGRVVITQIDETGTPLEEDVIVDEFPVGAKTIYNIRDHFTERSNIYYRIEASQPIIMTALRGSLDFTYLWENTAKTVGAVDQATYRVTFDATWSAATHPDDFPSTSHFSDLIGATHNQNIRFWEEGGLAGAGIEQMAESGETTLLTSEIIDAIATDAANVALTGVTISSPGSTSIIFTVKQTHPLITLITMLAPSPDWCAGVDSLCLYQANGWVDNLTVDLYPFDSGTDSGTTYTSPNEDTQPRQFIYRLIDEPFQIDYRVIPVGTFTFERLK